MSYQQSKEIHREFKVGYALTSYQVCPICKTHVQKSDITLISERIIKYPVVNQITKKYYHRGCFRENQLYKTSNRIAPVEYANGYELLSEQDKQIFREYIRSLQLRIIKQFPNLEEAYKSQQSQVNSNNNNGGNHQRSNVDVSSSSARQPQALLNSNKINSAASKIQRNHSKSTWNDLRHSSEEKKNHQQTLLSFSGNRNSQENKGITQFKSNYPKKLDYSQNSEKKQQQKDQSVSYDKRRRTSTRDQDNNKVDNQQGSDVHDKKNRFVSTSEKLEQLQRQQQSRHNIENQQCQEGRIVKKARLENGAVVIENSQGQQEQLRRNAVQRGDTQKGEKILNGNNKKTIDAVNNNQQSSKLNLIHKAPKLSNAGISYNSISSNPLPLPSKRPLVSFEINSSQSKERLLSETDRQLKQIDVSQKYFLVQLLENNGYLNVRNLSSQWLVCLAKDGVINGALPHCPICNDGQLIHNKIKDEYFCTGSSEKSGCKRAFSSQEIHRKKWNQLCI